MPRDLHAGHLQPCGGRLRTVICTSLTCGWRSATTAELFRHALDEQKLAALHGADQIVGQPVIDGLAQQIQLGSPAQRDAQGEIDAQRLRLYTLCLGAADAAGDLWTFKKEAVHDGRASWTRR